jgi:polyphosphate glucokinase
MVEERAVLVVDVGGSHVKLLASGETERRRTPSGPSLTPVEMVTAALEAARGWRWDVVALGVPGPVYGGRVMEEPFNLGKGWVGFDFEAAFGVPTRVINDAAMQALGSYEGGKMLFLGLGTGLGSALVGDGIVEPMEVAHRPFKKRTFEDYLGERGLTRLGRKRWQKLVFEAVAHLVAVLEPDSVVLGGGNAAKLDALPPNARLGDNDNAFSGGFRLWQSVQQAPGPGDRPPDGRGDSERDDHRGQQGPEEPPVTVD